MNISLLRSLYVVPALIACSLAVRAADTPLTAAGHWEGSINSPRPLEIRVDLSRAADPSWQATIDIPIQGFRGFKLGEVKVDGSAVAFAMPAIPGNPQFSGKLSEDGSRITGDYSQGGATVPFSLERKPAPVKTEEAPIVALPGKGLEGVWRGGLSPMPGMELRLSWEVTSAKAEKPDAVLVSLDQGNARIPVTVLTEKEGAVHFETPSVGGVFDGKLNADGSEISGSWTQGPGTLPLVLKRTGKAPETKQP